MATVRFDARPCERWNGGHTVIYNGTPLAQASAWVCNVAEAKRELAKFVEASKKTVKQTFIASASWPQNVRKPRGWNKADDARELEQIVDVPAPEDHANG